MWLNFRSLHIIPYLLCKNTARSLVLRCSIRGLCSNAHGVFVVTIDRFAIRATESISWCCCPSNGWVLFSVLFLVRVMVGVVGFFKIIRRCSFKVSLNSIPYRRLTATDWGDLHFALCFPYNCRTGEVLCIPEPRVSGKKRG